MNSFRPIPIHSSHKNDESMSSRSMDNMHNSWKLEKVIDERGKSNYKLITELNTNTDAVVGGSSKKNKTKRVQTHKPIAPYGVPGASAYMNTKAQTLNAPTLNSNIIKSLKKIKKNRITKAHYDAGSDSSSKSIKTDVEFSIERFASVEGKISNNMIIGNKGLIIPYGNGNDLLQKSYSHGHLVSSNIQLQNINVLLSYFGPKTIPCITVSIWSQTFSPAIELVNIITLPIQNLEPNRGKLIIKDIHADIVNRGQVFVTLNCTEEYVGNIDVKYSLEVSSVYEISREAEYDFEFPDFFNNGGFPVPVQMPIRVQEPIIQEIVQPTPEQPVQAVPAQVTKQPINFAPKTNKSIFGDFIKGKNEENVPIFGKKTPEMDQNDGSISMNQSIYANQAKKAANFLQDNNDDNDVDFTEKDDTDINKILNILRNQTYEN